MPSQITNLLAELFYEGRNKSIEGKNLFSKPLVYIDTSQTANRYETSLPVGKEKQLKDQIVELAGYTFQYIETDDYLTLEDIGIISAYKNQGDLIELKITAKYPHLKFKVNDMVASLDTYQNQERKAPERRRISSLCELRRLNMAMSRYEKQFILIGNDLFLRYCVHSNEKHSSDFIRLIGVIKALRNCYVTKSLNLLKCMRYIWN